MKKIVCFFLALVVIMLPHNLYAYENTNNEMQENDTKQVTVIRNGNGKEDIVKTYTYNAKTYNKSIKISPKFPKSFPQKDFLNIMRNTYSPNALIGPDTSSRVEDPSVYPYCAIAELVIRYNGVSGETYGTGFLIGDDLLATVGHNLIHIDKNGKHNINSLEVRFGNNGSSCVLRKTGWKTIITYGGDYQSFSPNIDYGFVQLTEGVSSEVGQFGVQTNISENQNFILAGYPSNYMYSSNGFVCALYNDYLEHNADSKGGQSGSPLYFVQSDGPYAFGMHHGGLENRFNWARRLDGGIVQWLFDNNFL